MDNTNYDDNEGNEEYSYWETMALVTAGSLMCIFYLIFIGWIMFQDLVISKGG